MQTYIGESIAIVGIGCRFPGDVSSPQSFWQFLMDGGDAIREIPADRFDLAAWFDARPALPGRMNTRWGGFLDNIDRFDAAFFEMSPREAERLDPQQRLLLETAWEALEDAGQAPGSPELQNTGVFIGAWLSDFEARLYQDPALADFHMTTGSGRYALSGRLSHFFGFSGPSIVVDAACASSLTAVALAVDSLQAGRCSLALAGGVNVILQPHITIAYSQSSMMSPDGRCKFGDAAANGYVRSEGAGVVALKRLSDAQAAGDSIYALILGAALNNDGRTSRSMGTPGQAGQEDLLRKAYAAAGINPGQVSYVEAHGTGTLAGDPVELAALGHVLGAARPAGQTLRVGSVKTNFGHTEGAAGIAGLIKVALALKHSKLPASLGFHTPNPNIDWHGLRVSIQSEPEAWQDVSGLCIAGVSGFGIAGSNAHVVLQEARQITEPRPGSPVLQRPAVLPLSARSPDALQRLVKQWQRFLAYVPQERFGDVLYSAACRRSHHAYRLAATGTSIDDLLQNMQAARHEPAGAVANDRKLVFVYPGQGGQWVGMGRGLYRTEAAFKETFDRCAAAMQPYLDRPLVEDLLSEAGAEWMDHIDVIQPMLFALQASLAELWKSWGVAPDAVIGHSMGEIAAAYTAGMLKLEDAARLICLRSRLMKQFSGQGAMLLVGLSLEEAEQRAQTYRDRLSPAVSNGPQTTVLSGDPAAVASLAAELAAEEVFCRILKVDVAAHSPQMESPASDLAQRLDGLRPQPERLPFYSTVTGNELAGEEAGAEYWRRNLRQPVRFYQAAESALANGFGVFLEISPHPTLINALQDIFAHEHAGSSGAAAIASLHRDEDEQHSMTAALGELYTCGARIDWSRVYPSGKFIQLPAYPWQRQRYWLSSAEAGAGRAGQEVHFPGRATPLADGSGTVFDLVLDKAHFPWLYDYRAAGSEVLPTSAVLEWMRQASEAVLSTSAIGLRDIELLRTVRLPEKDQRLEIQTIIKPHGPAGVRVYLRVGGNWELCASAALDGETGLDDPRLEPAFEPPVGQGQQPDALYSSLEQRGVVPGALLRDIARVWQEADRLVVSIENDAALNLPLEAALAAGRAFASSDASAPAPGQALMLQQVRKFIQLADPNRVAWVEARSDRTVLYDEQAKPLAWLVSPAWTAQATDESSNPQRWLYTSAWKELPPLVERAAEQAGAWLIFCDRRGYGEQLAARLEAEGRTCIRLETGASLQRLDARHWTLPVRAPEDFQKLVDTVIGELTGSALQGAVFCWGLDISSDQAPAKITEEPLALPVIYLIQALNARRFDGRFSLWLATQGTQSAGKIVAPLQAALWGLGRVIGNEHPDWWGGMIDLETGAEPLHLAQQLAAELHRPGISQRALIGGKTLALALESYDMGAISTPPYRWDPGGAYLITGGMGGVGLAAARWMIERGARRLILLGRTRLPDRSSWRQLPADDPLRERINAVLELEDLGAQVQLAAVDLSKPGEFTDWLRQYEEQGGRPVRGVLHAAVYNEDRLITTLDAPSVRRGFMAKASGALELVTQLADLDFCVFFSSVVALFGPVGTASYAASNAYLDALAGMLSSAGRPVININWSVWSNLGLARKENIDRTIGKFEDQGIRAFPASEGLEILGRVIDRLASRSNPPAGLAVIPMDWRAYQLAQSPRYGEDLFASHVLAAPAPTSPVESSQSFVLQIEKAAPGERRKILVASLEQIVRRVFHLADGPIDHHRPLGAMGMDSLMGIELRNQIQALLGLKLPATFVWSYPTLVGMADRLGILLEGEQPAGSLQTDDLQPDPVVQATQTQSAIQDVVQRVSSLSDEEALQKLLGAA